MIIVSSYNRPKMLKNLLEELHGNDQIVVVDDGSDFDPQPFLKYGDFYRFEHKGRDGYWLQYQYMLELAEESSDNWFMFIQDDISKVEWEKIKKICNGLEGPYAFNFMKRGADRRWTNIIWYEVEFNDEIEGLHMGYVDCNFCCPRETLSLLDFMMEPVSHKWLKNPFHSSGVGRQLSMRFEASGVPMYMPKKSLAYHGSHPSEMHERERKRNPLISK